MPLDTNAITEQDSLETWLILGRTMSRVGHMFAYPKQTGRYYRQALVELGLLEYWLAQVLKNPGVAQGNIQLMQGIKDCEAAVKRCRKSFESGKFTQLPEIFSELVEAGEKIVEGTKEKS